MQLLSVTSIRRSSDCNSHQQACWSFPQDHLRVHVAVQSAMILVLAHSTPFSCQAFVKVTERIYVPIKRNARLVKNAKTSQSTKCVCAMSFRTGSAGKTSFMCLTCPVSVCFTSHALHAGHFTSSYPLNQAILKVCVAVHLSRGRCWKFDRQIE